MGKFNELLAARFNDGPSAVLGLSEQEGIRTVAPELMPVFQVEAEHPEHQFVKGVKLWFFGGSEAAQAATFSHAVAFNPVGSNCLVVVTRCYCANLTSAGTLVAGVGITPAFATGLANNQAPVARDMRIPGSPGQNVVTVGRSGVNVARSYTISSQVGVPQNVSQDMINPNAGPQGGVVLVPGTFLAVSAGSVNQGIQFAFEGYERSLLPEENAS